MQIASNVFLKEKHFEEINKLPAAGNLTVTP
jgi:hypothetical protein